MLQYELQFCLLPEDEKGSEDSDEGDLGDAYLMTRPGAYCIECARSFPRLIIQEHGSDCLVCGSDGALRPGRKPKVEKQELKNGKTAKTSADNTSLEGIWISSPHRFPNPSGYVFGCVPNRQYAFRVRARNNLGWSHYSEETAGAYAIDPIKAHTIGARFLDLIWPKPAGAGTVLAYELQMRKAATLEGPFLHVSSTLEHPTFRVNDLEPLSTYSFRVRWKNSFGWCSWDRAAVSQVIWTRPAVPQAVEKPPLCVASSLVSLPPSAPHTIIIVSSQFYYHRTLYDFQNQLFALIAFSLYSFHSQRVVCDIGMAFTSRQRRSD